MIFFFLAPLGNQNIDAGKTSCHESSRVCDAFGQQDSRLHFLCDANVSGYTVARAKQWPETTLQLILPL